MFQIEPSPVVGARGDSLRVIDHSRDVWLQRITSHGADSGYTFQLVRGHTPIALDTIADEHVDADGRTYYLSQIVAIGGSPLALRVAGIDAVAFATADDKDAATELAAEALLVYGNYYDGLSKPEGQFRVSYSTRGEQRIATLASFGYLPA
jgi:hypothetical protein